MKLLNIKSDDNGKTLNGTMTYEGEGPIGFKGTRSAGDAYVTENSWAGTYGHPGGLWIIGCREGQNVIQVDASSSNNGGNLDGKMTYEGEGPIGLKATLRGDNAGNNYNTENSWGGSGGHDGGRWVVGTRGNQQGVVNLDIKSGDGGKSFSGNMTYNGEGPIGVTGTLVSA